MSDEALFEAVYEDLRRIARGLRAGDAISPTSVVHEAFIRLRGHGPWNDDLHYKRVAAKAMRHIVIDRARAVGAAKRGGSLERVTLSSLGDAHDTFDLVALAEVLEQLEQLDPDLLLVLELRAFSGLTHPEIAQVLELDTRTAQRRWRRVRAFVTAAMARHG